VALTSLPFVAFVAAVLAVFYLLPGRLQRPWLLMSSVVFYASYAWQFPAVLLALTLATWAIGMRVRHDDRLHAPWLALGIGLLLATLAFFKAAGFFLDARAGVHAMSVLLPIGLSFTVLQAISYLIDVARGHLAAERDVVTFALYLAYFPKLLSGPIERARTFLPQLRRARVLDDERLARSTMLIAVGLVRKVVIADSLFAMIPARPFTDPAQAAGHVEWLVLYTFALYNDFAGYTNLAQGISGLFGIDLAPNFAQPFFARSFTEFWNRWHMSLLFWLRDYIYFPLSRALLRRHPGRDHALNLVVPSLAAMLACGLWHGPRWGFLLWGGLHGTYLVGERLAGLWRPPVPVSQRPAWQQVVGAIRVFTLATLAFIPFRMDLPIAGSFAAALLTARAWRVPNHRALVLIALALAIDVVQARADDELVFLRWPRLVRVGLLAAVLGASIVILASDTSPAFVYAGF
jgi:D-alanyl-lipoteichoic acid acyltransferase DltB (MBOAT superfamily)